jgi:hypothetical protein
MLVYLLRTKHGSNLKVYCYTDFKGYCHYICALLIYGSGFSFLLCFITSFFKYDACSSETLLVIVVAEGGEDMLRRAYH